MNDNSNQKTRMHNTALAIITATCLGAVIESVSQGWEFWVPPLIFFGLVACWIIHLAQYGKSNFRENNYIIFSMLVSFYNGMHTSSFFDVIVISSLLMVTVTLLKRKDFLNYLLIEFFVIMITQIILVFHIDSMQVDSLYISRIALHIVAQVCIYRILGEVIKNGQKDDDELNKMNKEREYDKIEMEDFLVNISHELRTPVNVINGLSTIILKNEMRDDVISIRDAGLRLSRQIEDIQDYSEVQRGNVLLEEDKYMITSLLNDIIADYNIRESGKNIDLIIDLDPTLPAMMKGDANKIGKIIRHLLSNAAKFTKRGGIYLKISGIRREYGINLLIEVTDTGIGMTKKDIEKISKGIYQIDKKRNRSTGGIGLGLPIVYGFVRKMNGFTSIESKKGKGTTVRVSIVQEIVSPASCLSIENENFINVVFHIIPEKYSVAKVREFYKQMATNIATAFRVNLYFAPSIVEVKKLIDRGNVTHLFMGAEEYKVSSEFFDEIAGGDITVAVSAPDDFMVNAGSDVIVMPKPLYGYPIVRILNGDMRRIQPTVEEEEKRPILDGIRALVVDDEPMNLVVATGIFKEYKMLVDTAESGRQAIEKFSDNDYDVVFMDHMMPGMDGVEAMKRLKDIAATQMKTTRMVALTANAISGAKEMFLSEGFDGFISKPININDFERTMSKVLPSTVPVRKEAAHED